MTEQELRQFLDNAKNGEYAIGSIIGAVNALIASKDAEIGNLKSYNDQLESDRYHAQCNLEIIDRENKRLREGIQLFIDYMKTDALEFGMGIWVDRLGSQLKPDGYWNPTEFRRQLEDAGVLRPKTPSEGEVNPERSSSQEWAAAWLTAGTPLDSPASDENGLLPCPHCRSHNLYMRAVSNGKRHIVSCQNCDASIRSATRSGVITAWNKRLGKLEVSPAPVILCTQCNSHRIEKIGVGLDGYNSRYCWECHAEFSEGAARDNENAGNT